MGVRRFWDRGWKGEGRGGCWGGISLLGGLFMGRYMFGHVMGMSWACMDVRFFLCSSLLGLES